MKIISRSEAKALGLKRYFSGKRCKNGHLDERYTTTNTCVGCVPNDPTHRAYQRAKSAAWYQANLEYAREKRKKYAIRARAVTDILKQLIGPEQLQQLLQETENDLH